MTKATKCNCVRSQVQTAAGDLVHPQTYNLPRDFAHLQAQMLKDPSTLYMLKPTDKQAQSVYLFHLDNFLAGNVGV